MKNEIVFEKCLELLEERDKERVETEKRERDICKRVAYSIDIIASGVVYFCPECIEPVIITNDTVTTSKLCKFCGERIFVDDMESYTLNDYLENDYVSEYRVGSDHIFHSVEFTKEIRNTKVYIDTNTGLVWTTQFVSCPLTDSAVYHLNKFAEELWNDGY